MTWPKSTGDVRKILKVPEHRLRNLVRLEKIDVPLLGGRRLWSLEHATEAARLLGADTIELRNALRESEGAQ